MHDTSGVLFDNDLGKLKELFDNTPRKAVVFYHMHKTGGRSLATALQDSVPKKYVHRISSAVECDTFEQKVHDGILDEEQTYFLYGHRTIRLADLFNQKIPVFGITVLRDPIEMFGSRFSYQHTRHGRTDLTSESFIKQYKSNSVLKFLKFNDSDDALARYQQYFSFVCIQENLSDSLSMLNYVLSLPSTEFESQNVVRAEDYVELNPDLAPQFVRENMEDYIFYESMKLRHSQLKRQFKRMDGTTQVKFQTSENSLHAPADLNFDLENNTHKFSLLLTGMEVWKTDQDQAMKFFDKAFGYQWSLANRVFDFLHPIDPKKATRWVKEKIGELDNMDGNEAAKMSKSLKLRLKEKQDA